MTSPFSMKLVTSQLPLLTRRSSVLKRIMWAGLAVATACLIPTLYFAYATIDLNAVSQFAYDFPKNVIALASTLPSADDSLAMVSSTGLDALIKVAMPLSATLGIAGILYAGYRVVLGDGADVLMPVSGAVIAFAGGFFFLKAFGLDISDDKPLSTEQRLYVAIKQHNAAALLELVKDNPGVLNEAVAGHTDVPAFMEGVGYLDLQRDLKEGHIDARKTERFVHSSYFRQGMASFQPDVLTAIEKAAYGHPVSARAERYQTAVIDPQRRQARLRAFLSAGFMVMGFLTGVSAFLLSRSIRKRVTFLQTLPLNEGEAR